MRTSIAAALICGAMIFQPVFALADEAGHSIDEMAIEMAHTPDQHAALAQHYRAKAAAERALVKKHEAMGRAYNVGKFIQRQRMQRHCKNLASKHSEMAGEYDALAKLHEEEAKASE